MNSNNLIIVIDKPLREVFLFCITPPNTILWVPGIVAEETSEWPIRVGTIDRMQNAKGEMTSVKVVALEEDKMIEWQSDDGNYHCRYTLRPLDKNRTEFTYHEWTDVGDIETPFTKEVLEKMKTEIEKR